jgi:nucleoside-diphosphate-sugar epimerase
MRALVSGGAGHVGSHLSAQLLDAGHDVICVDNLSTSLRSNLAALFPHREFSFWEKDVTEPFASNHKIDWIFHLASPASPPDYLTRPLETLSVNSVGTLNLLRLADSHGARFLYASTSEVYGDPEVHPQPETYWGHVNPNGARSCYDEGKRFGEALTFAFGRRNSLDTRIVRIFNTYGPNSRPDDGRMVPNFICQALRGEPLTIYGDGTQTRSLAYVTDTARGILAVMEADGIAGEAFNIGNPEERTVEQFAAEVARACGVDDRVEYRTLPADDPSRRCPDISKIRSKLGWEPLTSFDEGLERTVAWFRSTLTDIAVHGGASSPDPAFKML